MRRCFLSNVFSHSKCTFRICIRINVGFYVCLQTSITKFPSPIFIYSELVYREMVLSVIGFSFIMSKMLAFMLMVCAVSMQCVYAILVLLGKSTTHIDNANYSNVETNRELVRIASHVWLEVGATSVRCGGGQPTELSIITYQLCAQIALLRWSLECYFPPPRPPIQPAHTYRNKPNDWTRMKTEDFGGGGRVRSNNSKGKYGMNDWCGTKLVASVYLCVLRRLCDRRTTRRASNSARFVRKLKLQFEVQRDMNLQFRC